MMRNAVWALSNLCRGKNPPPDFTKVIFQNKYSTVAQAHSISHLHNIVHSAPNLCLRSAWLMHKVSCPYVSYHFLPPQVSPCLSVLSWLLFVNDTDILADACWALSYLSDGPNDKIQAVIDSGVCRRLVELLM